jgi:hypothetical protein
MAYPNLPGVKVGYSDGALRIVTGTQDPRVLILGSAQSGLTYELFLVSNFNQAETEFGASSEVMRGAHEVLGQGVDNVAVMRIGGTQGN